MIGVHPVEPGLARTYLGNFIRSFPDPESRRRRALGFIPVNGEVRATEAYGSRLVLASQWAHPVMPHYSNLLPSLLETVTHFANIGNTAEKLVGQKVMVLNGLDARAVLKDSALAVPTTGFSVNIGTLTGELSNRPAIPSTGWRRRKQLGNAPSLAVRAAIEVSHPQSIVVDPLLGEAKVTIAQPPESDPTSIPVAEFAFYTGRVCLEPSIELYHNTREVEHVTEIIFGDTYCFDALNNLTKRAGELGFGDHAFPDLDFSA